MYDEDKILSRFFTDLGKEEELPPAMKEDVLALVDASKLFCDFVDLFTAKQLEAQAVLFSNLLKDEDDE